MKLYYEYFVLSGRSLYDELIIRPEESYRRRCIFVSDQETSTMGKQRPTLGRITTGKKKTENRLKVYKLCDMKFAMFSPQRNFDVGQTYEFMQTLQSVITDVPNNLLPTYVYADFQIYSFCKISFICFDSQRHSSSP